MNKLKRKEKKMKVIFLDVDGVLNCNSTKQRIPYYDYLGIEDRFVELLADLVKNTKARIVLSSSWRDGWIPDKYGDQETHGIYLDYKLAQYKLEIYDYTPVLNGWCRGMEIKEWLEKHDDVTDYVIIDDEYFPDFKKYKVGAHVIRTSTKTGLTEKHIKRAEKVLCGEDYMTEAEEDNMLKESDFEHFGRSL